MFAANYGVHVDPNAPPSAALTQAIIDHALFSHTDAQVAAWANSGDSVAQVLEAFAFNDHWASYVGTYYSGGVDDTTTFSLATIPVASIVGIDSTDLIVYPHL